MYDKKKPLWRSLWLKWSASSVSGSDVQQFSGILIRSHNGGGKESKIDFCVGQVRILLVMTGWVPRCGCGAEIGRYLLGHSGSSPATCHRGKRPPPDELRPRGFHPPAVVDWPPGKRSQWGRHILELHVNKLWRSALIPTNRCPHNLSQEDILTPKVNTWNYSTFHTAHLIWV